MPPRRHSADLRGRRQDLGIGVRDMADGLGVGLRRLLAMEDGTATEEDKTFYRTWLSRTATPAAKTATSSKRGQPRRRRDTLPDQEPTGPRGGVIARV
jgi:hypothetical protein